MFAARDLLEHGKRRGAGLLGLREELRQVVDAEGLPAHDSVHYEVGNADQVHLSTNSKDHNYNNSANTITGTVESFI